MQHLWRWLNIVLLLWLGVATAVTAQQTIPEFRYVATPDMDFYGDDLDPLFDTDLTSCVRACTARPDCAAFTYNSRSNACFPKRRVSEKRSYQGAVSALRIDADPARIARAEQHRAAASFIAEDDWEQAVKQARTLGLNHPAGGQDAAALLDAARQQSAAGNLTQAANLTAMATSLTDEAAAWTGYARRLLAINTDKERDARALANRALSAALNGYLRAADSAGQVTAMLALSEAFERVGRGREMIPALRLAQSLQPDDTVARALERAIGKHGFRVTDSTVESDSASPRICAQFSEPLSPVGVDYDSYIRRSQSGLVVQADGTQLCVDGVEHGARYRLTLRAGLPAASGETLLKDVELTQYVRDRAPSVRFPGRTYVLPRSADAALPVETVNVTTLDLRLRRISDRNLLRAVQDGYFARPLSQWQDQSFATDIAEEVWTGTAEVGNTLNRDMTTRLPIDTAIAGQPAGIFALTARIPGADPYDDPGATQWFVLSDLGISSLSGTDGLHVTLRGLSDAAARAGVEVMLISRANAVLGRATTDASGHALFEAGLTRGVGGAAPALILARDAQGDVGFLSLTDPAFDLSDRGVEGRAPAGPVDVFLSTDRGAYRAGETIHVTALARDDEATAIDDLPLTLILSRPDGVEYARRVSNGGVAGGHVFSLPVAPDAPRGTWRVEVKGDPDAPALASQPVLVEDFLPERIDFDLALSPSPQRSGDTPRLQIDARYLFGAPGSDLTIEGQATLRPVAYIDAWPGYRFGRHDAQGDPASSFFGDQRTNAQGAATLALELPQIATPDMPMQLVVTARLADGAARPVERQITMPVRPASAIIGIKPLFDEAVAEGSEAAFELIGLSSDLTPATMDVRWTLNRIETRYQWYQLYGNWNWEPTTRRTRIATGETTLNGPVTLSQPVDWGEYELVVERTDGAYAAASVNFSAGWYVSADATSTPDRLDLSLDRESYRPGDTAKLRIVPQAAGTALITVMSSRVIHREVVEVEAGATVIPLSVTPDWGTGAYVSATVLRPMDVPGGRNPSRAIGLAHAAIDPADKVLNVTIDTPDTLEPRRTHRTRISVDGANPGDEVWLTLAAVDLGILNLTGFQSPDPTGHYFGQRQLGMELRDIYGRLIDGMNGALGTVRSGGDSGAGLRMQSPPPTQELMSAFSGPVRVDGSGEAYVNLDLPAFNGTVRLMVIAWSRNAVGQAESDIVVRDPVVVAATLPNFLAPGDTSRLRLDVVHADGPAGDMQLAVTSGDSALEIGKSPDAFLLARDGKAVFDIPLTVRAVGDAVIDVTLTLPDGRDLRQTLTLPIRANDPVIAQTRRFSLASGQSFEFSDDLFADLRKGTGKAILSAGPLARFDAPGLLATLDRYPYGCTEQVTSQALPLLYLSSVAQATGLGDGRDIDARISTAISRVLARQSSNGAFGLWSAGSGDFWLDAYVSDFLGRARAQGHPVPDRAFRLAMDNLRNRINYAPEFDNGGEDIAYALMVLAREGLAEMGDLRYYADVKANAFATPLAAAQLGAALAYYGDQTRADAMFARAARKLETARTDPLLWRADYGTDLRDAAGVLALATEAGSQAVDLADLTQRVTAPDARLSTQEAAWSLLAAQALITAPEQSGLRVDGAPVAGPFVQVLDGETAQPGMTITAASGRDTDITLTTMGIPETPPAAGGTGYAISRSHYSMDGAPLDPGRLVVGTRFVTVLRIDPFEESAARLMIDDPLPAGVEIDNPNLLRAGDVAALDWLSLSDATHTEFRSDRFLAAVDMHKAGPVTLAYVARAVTPGRFHHPAASVEDMYRPRFRARTETGRVTVAK
ncbi:alpha-2-macroglobulin family protein [Sedimentitalea sp. XS_ASV28]|uniref:alpha-2-macroglobulin family protein n=1 Tax=Sedimentitalea sp. XS_ASV28 TaxID=3241296 RepID=UPI0035124DDC